MCNVASLFKIDSSGLYKDFIDKIIIFAYSDTGCLWKIKVN